MDKITAMNIIINFVTITLNINIIRTIITTIIIIIIIVVVVVVVDSLVTPRGVKEIEGPENSGN